MTPDEPVIFTSAAGFRRWLEAHHASARELWVGYYRKGVGRPSITYPEAVDEALCFGWIDGIGRRIDEEVHANRFTPRRPRSNWSAKNVTRVGELRRAGRMHAAGIAAFEARREAQTGIYSYENRPADLPDAYLRPLVANAQAHDWWRTQSASYRRAATWWLLTAKREATRAARLAQLIADCEAGRRIKPLSRAEHAPAGTPVRHG